MRRGLAQVMSRASKRHEEKGAVLLEGNRLGVEIMEKTKGTGQHLNRDRPEALGSQGGQGKSA